MTARDKGHEFRPRLYAEAQRQVDAILQGLPEPLRDQARALPVVFEDVPGARMVRDGVEPDLMGLFVGDAYAESGQDPLPAEIILFLRNIWDEAGHETGKYRRQVRKTFLHEIGHYLGLDEADLDARQME